VRGTSGFCFLALSELEFNELVAASDSLEHVPARSRLSAAAHRRTARGDGGKKMRAKRHPRDDTSQRLPAEIVVSRVLTAEAFSVSPSARIVVASSEPESSPTDRHSRLSNGIGR
jgi:hypothetical protein